MTTMEFLRADDPSEIESWWSSLILLFRRQRHTIKTNISSRYIPEIVFTAAVTTCWWIIGIRWRKEKAGESTAVQIGIRSSTEANGNSVAQLSCEAQWLIECEYCFLSNSSSIVKRTSRLCEMTHRSMKCYSRAARGQPRYVNWHSKSLSLVEFQLPVLYCSTVFLANGMSIPWYFWSLHGIRWLFKWQEYFEMDNRSTRFVFYFRSTDGVQKILQCSHISIDSIRYPAVAYKPLARIDRCFCCQQFGHKAAKCSNEPKCCKCGESHEYNRDCANVVKCANRNGQHIASSPECPVKNFLSLREETTTRREVRNNSTAINLLSLFSCSTVLQTMAPHVHADAKAHKMIPDRPTGQINQSSIIIFCA